MSAAAALSGQWTNPRDITAVLLLISSDLVHKALARGTGAWFVPVCFSFGWVGYSFAALIRVLGDGRLMPPSDYPVQIFHLSTGIKQENKGWQIGRLMRSHESTIARRHSRSQFRITVFEAVTPEAGCSCLPLSRWQTFGLLVMLLQLGVAAIPIILFRNWVTMLITASGTLLSLLFGMLPQWTIEKRPGLCEIDVTYGLTGGNSSRDVLIIKSLGNIPCLGDFATPNSPRNAETWARSSRFHRADLLGFSVGYWITIVSCALQCILWLSLLLAVAATEANTWFMLAVGLFGMFQNAITAEMETAPQNLGLPLKEIECIVSATVMDGLMDLEVSHGGASALVNEFFPGRLSPDEIAWWNGDREAYDSIRRADCFQRTPPRSFLQAQSKDQPPVVVSLPAPMEPVVKV